jgi:hypothetical protein
LTNEGLLQSMLENVDRELADLDHSIDPENLVPLSDEKMQVRDMHLRRRGHIEAEISRLQNPNLDM